MQLIDQKLLFFSEFDVLWKELAVLCYGEEQVLCFLRGVCASNRELHGLHGYLERT